MTNEKELTMEEIRNLVKEGKFEQIPVEDLLIYMENLEKRCDMVKDAIRDLYYAICEQACQDYYMLAHGRKVEGMRYGDAIEDLSKFFYDDFFRDNFKQDPEKVMVTIQSIPAGYETAFERR